MQAPYNVTDIGIQLKVFVSMKKAAWELFLLDPLMKHCYYFWSYDLEMVLSISLKCNRRSIATSSIDILMARTFSS